MDKKKVSLKDEMKNQEIIEDKETADDISEPEEDEYSKMSQDQHKQKMITDDLKQKIITYIKLDDAIKKYQDEIKKFKDMRKPCEEAIINHLEGMNEDAFNLNSGDRIIKNKIESKAPINIDIIKDSIKEELVRENIVDSVERCDKVINDILEILDKKRPVKTKVTIRRTKPKVKGQKK